MKCTTIHAAVQVRHRKVININLILTYNTLSRLMNSTHYYHFYTSICLYLQQHPRSNSYYLCSRYCISHLTFPPAICLSKLQSKRAFKNHKLSHITLSSSSVSLMSSSCSYMKIELFCKSHLVRHFHREAFLYFQTRSVLPPTFP